MGSGSNNFVELLSLNLLLSLSLDRKVKKLHILGDSQLVINWATGKYLIQNVQLDHILMEIHRMVDMFDSLSFMHIYRERNSYADILAKEGDNVLSGTWHISKHKGAKRFENDKLF